MLPLKREYHFSPVIQGRYAGKWRVHERFFFNDFNEPRFGITTPRRSGKAVERNRVKRVMREYYRCNKDAFPKEGALLFKLKKCCETERVITEMLNLTNEVMRK